MGYRKYVAEKQALDNELNKELKLHYLSQFRMKSEKSNGGFKHNGRANMTPRWSRAVPSHISENLIFFRRMG